MVSIQTWGCCFRISVCIQLTGMTPQIETTDNAFKIILPNLNVISELEEPTQTRLEKDIPEKKVIALTKERVLLQEKRLRYCLTLDNHHADVC